MLKNERIAKGKTQEQLAEDTGIDPRTILRIEKNQKVVSLCILYSPKRANSPVTSLSKTFSSCSKEILLIVAILVLKVISFV